MYINQCGVKGKKKHKKTTIFKSQIFIDLSKPFVTSLIYTILGNTARHVKQMNITYLQLPLDMVFHRKNPMFPGSNLLQHSLVMFEQLMQERLKEFGQQRTCLNTARLMYSYQ
jgi:hypothetical protein